MPNPATSKRISLRATLIKSVIVFVSKIAAATIRTSIKTTKNGTPNRYRESMLR